MKNIVNVPKHIGFILDGNGRWATQRKLPRVLGHKKGTVALKRVLNACIKHGIQVVSLYAFSSENWKRPQKERETLFSMIKQFVRDDMANSLAKPVQIRVMGDITALPSDVCESIKKAVKDTEKNDGMIVNIGLNYGGRAEIVTAVNRAIKNGEKEITPDIIDNYLDTAGLPPLDLVVRTSGEIRLSNFMLWQVAYSEMIFLEKLWPDMKAKDVEFIIKEFSSRNRKFGGITNA